MTTIKQALQEATRSLNSNESARLEAEILLAHVLSVSRTFLYAHSTDELPLDSYCVFQKKIKARQEGHPIAYLTGSKEFWSLSFMVNHATLIPRPETELLIEHILALPQQHRIDHVLDLGTGSGAIAIALAHMRPSWRITALDRSQEALDIAKRNAEAHGIHHIHFLVSDWFERILPEDKFDVIVSNPPYLKDTDPHLNEGDLRFEPIHALSSGRDGLDAIRTIVASAPSYLKHAGFLFLEHGYDQASSVASLLDQKHFKNICSTADIQGHLRITQGQWLGENTSED